MSIYLFIHMRGRGPPSTTMIEGNSELFSCRLGQSSRTPVESYPFYPPRKALEWLTQRRCSELAFLHGPCGEPRHQSLASASFKHPVSSVRITIIHYMPEKHPPKWVAPAETKPNACGLEDVQASHSGALYSKMLWLPPQVP